MRKSKTLSTEYTAIITPVLPLECPVGQEMVHLAGTGTEDPCQETETFEMVQTIEIEGTTWVDHYIENPHLDRVDNIWALHREE